MSGYVKIYGSILGSSVWAEAPTTRIVWITMLALADKDGHVEASTSGLARFANVTLIECRKALADLSAPDLDSKSPEWGGRRVEKVEGGWLVLNYMKYRELRSPKQIADAVRAQEYRNRRNAGRDASQTSHGVATAVDVDEAVSVAVKTSSSPSSGKLVENLLDMLPTEDDRAALLAICTRVPDDGRSWLAEARSALEGMHGFTLTPKQLGEALREYVGNGALAHPSFRHFRAYLRKAVEPDAVQHRSAKPNPGAQQVANILGGPK